jgi:hypothetical protein
LPGIEALAHELLARELRGRPAQFRPAPKFHGELPTGVEVRALNPEVAAVAGGLADAASTYSFLTRRTGVEENAMFGSAKNGPSKTALAVVASALGMRAMRAMLRKAGFGRFADLLAGAQGAHQIALAAQNAHYDSVGGFPPGSSSDADVRAKVHTALTRP